MPVLAMRPTNIITTSFKSSNLAIPSTPFTPKFPKTPKLAPPTIRKRSVVLPTRPPPAKPLPWVWQCHICHHTYSLGTTRRCLEDGHYFCAGTTVVKRRGRSGRLVKKHKACASEFDYQGWEAWGEWRREQEEIHDSCTRSAVSPLEDAFAAALDEKPHKDCWANCDYPSECRWGKRMGSKSKTKEVVVAPTPLPAPNAQPATTFENILQSLESAFDTKSSAKADRETAPKAEKDDFWSVLLSSASRRKSTAHAGDAPLVPSPLSLSPVLEDIEMTDAPPLDTVSVPEACVTMAEKSSSFQVKSVRKVSHTPLIAPEPTFQMPSPEANLDVLCDGLGAAPAPLMSYVRSTSPEVKERKKLKKSKSLDRLRRKVSFLK